MSRRRSTAGSASPDPDRPARTVRRDSYFEQSRRPWPSLVFLLPLLLAYELGTWAYHLDSSRNLETRVVAFTWIREAFARLGATGIILPPATVIFLLLGWQVFGRQPWTLRFRTLPAMAAESVMMALPLMLLASIVRDDLLLAQADGSVGQVWLQLSVLGLGAGIYEELLFRLIGFALLHAILADGLGLRPRPTLILSLLVTSVGFALYHHVGGAEMTSGALLFRTLAGAWLGLTFVARGYGIAAGAHAAYDVLIVSVALLRPL